MKTAAKKHTPDFTSEEHETPPLARTERERAFFEFEQALISASEAFYRFAGAALGPTGRQHNPPARRTLFSSS